jgi:hypothetical protein
MPTVMFRIKNSVPLESVDQVLGTVARCNGVDRVAKIDPSSSIPEIQRMGYADVRSAEAAEALVEELNNRNDIATAAPPAERHLLSNP